jgi:hypothetical protein
MSKSFKALLGVTITLLSYLCIHQLVILNPHPIIFAIGVTFGIISLALGFILAVKSLR